MAAPPAEVPWDCAFSMPGSMVMDELVSDSAAVVENRSSLNGTFRSLAAGQINLIVFLFAPGGETGCAEGQKGNRQCVF